MKNYFPGYFPQGGHDIKRLWDKCIFAFDANILLNLYRYSDKTRDEFLRVLNFISDRTWLPYRAAEEFFANRLSVIGQQEKAYDETIRTIDALRVNLENARQHPFVSDGTLKRVQQIFDKLKQELTSNQSVHTNRITDDSVLASIARIFTGRVGEPYKPERLKVIFEEGQLRYTESIPPGFSDHRKSDDSGTHLDKCRKYGDLLVWFQVLDYAQSEGVSVILVTDDKKEDWWEMFRGKTLGPRPELVQEFLTKTGHSFHMYQADRFLEFANQYLKQDIAETTLTEIREVRRRAVEAQNAVMRTRERELERLFEHENLRNQEIALHERLKSLNNKRNELLAMLQKSIPNEMPMLEQMGKIDAERSKTMQEIGFVSSRLNRLDKSSSIGNRSIEQEPYP